MPKPIQNPRLGTALQSEFNLVGRVRPVLDEVVVPVVLAGDLRTATAPVVRRAMARFTQSAVALEYTGFRLEIPPGLVAEITHIFAGFSGADINLRVGVNSSELTAPGNTGEETFLDGRLRGNGQAPACALTYDTQAAAITAPYVLNLRRGSTGWSDALQVPIIGAGLNGAYGFIEFQELAVNKEVSLDIVWVEYLPA